jgi:hypothetical protein
MILIVVELRSTGPFGFAQGRLARAPVPHFLSRRYQQNLPHQHATVHVENVAGDIGGFF